MHLSVHVPYLDEGPMLFSFAHLNGSRVYDSREPGAYERFSFILWSRVGCLLLLLLQVSFISCSVHVCLIYLVNDVRKICVY